MGQGTYSACWVIWSHSTRPMPLDVSRSYQPVFCSDSPHTRCCWSNASQLQSIWRHRTRAMLQLCAADAREPAPLRKTVLRETTAGVSHWGHEIAWAYALSGRKVDVCSRPGSDFCHCKCGEWWGAHHQPTQASWVAYYGSGGKWARIRCLEQVKPWHIAISLFNVSVRRTNLTLLSLQLSAKWKTETGEGFFSTSGFVGEKTVKFCSKAVLCLQTGFIFMRFIFNSIQMFIYKII